MNEEEILIIFKGEDKTKEIQQININYNRIEIKFYNNEKIYSCSKDKVIIKERPIVIDLKTQDIYYKNQILFNVQKAIKFEEFVKIIYSTGDTEIFKSNSISFKPNTTENVNKNVIQYFREISKYVKSGNEENEEKNNHKESFLKKEYEKLNYIHSESVLNYYINKMDLKKSNEERSDLIYPFRFNLSQKQAMENVFKSNISVIEGPPGTGKTQTILNIIANLAIMQGKSVAVVSNNNEAVKNVKNKLEKNGYGFIVADLGRKQKREKFLKKYHSLI